MANNSKTAGDRAKQVKFGARGLGMVVVVVVSQFNGTSTPKGSYSAKTGDNDCNSNSSRYSLRTALCESIRYQAKSEQNVRQDLIPRVHHGEAALMYPEVGYGVNSRPYRGYPRNINGNLEDIRRNCLNMACNSFLVSDDYVRELTL